MHALITKQFFSSFSYSILLHKNNIIVTQKQYIFFGHLSAKTKIFELIATYCNETLIHCNNINNKIDQLLTFYYNTDTIKMIS
jgi:hypothetical protein